MRCKYLVGVTVLSVAWIGSSLLAQERDTKRPKRVLLIDQIDELGRTIFDGLLSPFSDDVRRRPPADTSGRPTRYANRSSLVRGDNEKGGKPSSTASGHGSKKSTPETPSASRSNHWRDLGHTLISPGESETLVPGYISTAKKDATAPVLKDSTPAPGASAKHSGSDPATRKLHERLMVLRESAFGDTSESGADADSGPETKTGPGPGPETVSRPSIRQPTPNESTPHRPHVGGHTTAGQPTAHTHEATSGHAREATSGEPTVRQPTLAGGAIRRAKVAREDQAEVALGNEPMAASNNPIEEEEKEEDSPTRPLAGDVAQQQGPAGGLDGDDVLMTHGSPALDVRTVGPRRITVGKPASFVVSISNSAPVAADQVVVTIDLPPWADVVGAEPSTGTTGWAEPVGSSKPFQWVVGRLVAEGREDLILDIVPRKSLPFDLAVKWDYKPVTSQAAIEVQEPKLEITLDGPREILYGAKEVYRLELYNSGTGDAENVELSLVAVGAGKNRPATHTVGLVEAGTRKAVEVELTARQTGGLTVRVEARGDGGVEARLLEEIVVVKPELEVQIEAPAVQYLNAVVEYKIRVSNSGTASAKGVTITAAIPTGAKHESSAPGGVLGTGASEVTWTLDSLAPGAEKSFTLSCTLEQPGARHLKVRTAAEGDLRASSQATTIVETMPDLVLDVKDPVGPIPVGTEATYRVAIRNRGTQTALGVEVVAYFSRGIEPTAAQGGRHRIGSGQVVFEPIVSLGVGEERTLEIQARAETAGNHICRVEVHCKASGIRLVSEEMTHFYAGRGQPQHAELDGPKPADDVVRTAESQPSVEEGDRTR